MGQADFTILIVDDEPEYREGLRKIVELEGYTVEAVGSGEGALKEVRVRKYDLILTDFMMEGINGNELLEILKREHFDIEVIMITAYATIQGAVETIKKGAFSYFVKGNNPEELLNEIKKVKERKMIQDENAQLLIKKEQTSFITQNLAFDRVIKMARKAASSNANILLLGESGTGKEIFAQYIHQSSERKRNPFVAVNCHAFQETLLESELFGHKKGAFTGATEDRMGRVEAAQGGTLFLDEIADAPISTQIKLLRTIENREIERIGTNKIIDVDFRLISATNRNLKQLIETGSFREDFYFRLSTIVLEIPPLRERKEDIPGLARQFMIQWARELNKCIHKIAPQTMEFLMAYDYPGNVRELKNIIERMVVFNEGETLQLNDCEDCIFDDLSNPTLKEVRQKAEREWIQKSLVRNGYAMGQTATELGITRRQLHNKIQEYGLKK